jgi:TIR domain
MPKKLNVFLSYAHADEAMKTELDRNLVMLKRSEKINVWQDRMIQAGTEWDAAISTELANADIILLLISVDFNNSQYIWDKELKVAMDRHEKNEARVIPVILRTCEWSEMPYAKLQALPTNATPISSFADKDVAYTEVARSIRMLVDHLLEQ